MKVVYFEKKLKSIAQKTDTDSRVLESLAFVSTAVVLAVVH